MGQDIRELLKQDNRIPSGNMREGHQQRFMARLEDELPKKARKFDFGWMRIAASIAIILSVSVVTFNKFGNNTTINTDQIVNVDAESKDATVMLSKQRSPLADMFPDFQTHENHTLTRIKFQLAAITINSKNKELVESFMKRLRSLDKEYQDLNKELIAVGPNIQSVEALMENLELRLNVLKRLKDNLQELEKIENENYTDIQA